MSVAPLSVMIDGGGHLGRAWVWPNSCRRQSLVLLRLKPHQPSGPARPAPAPHSCSRKWFPRPAPARCGHWPRPCEQRPINSHLLIFGWYLLQRSGRNPAIVQPAACSSPATGYGPELSSHIVSTSLPQRASRQHASYANIVCMWGLVMAWDDDNHHPASCQLISSSHSPHAPPAQSVHRCTHCHCRSRRQKWRGRNYQWIIMLTTRIHCTSTSRPQLRVGTLEPLTLSLLPSGDCCTSLAISRRARMIMVAVTSVFIRIKSNKTVKVWALRCWKNNILSVFCGPNVYWWLVAAPGQ